MPVAGERRRLARSRGVDDDGELSTLGEAAARLGDLRGAVVIRPVIRDPAVLLRGLHVLLEELREVAPLEAQRLLDDVAHKGEPNVQRALDVVQVGEERRVICNKPRDRTLTIERIAHSQKFFVFIVFFSVLKYLLTKVNTKVH